MKRFFIFCSFFFALAGLAGCGDGVTLLSPPDEAPAVTAPAAPSGTATAVRAAPVGQTTKLSFLFTPPPDLSITVANAMAAEIKDIIQANWEYTNPQWFEAWEQPGVNGMTCRIDVTPVDTGIAIVDEEPRFIVETTGTFVLDEGSYEFSQLAINAFLPYITAEMRAPTWDSSEVLVTTVTPKRFPFTLAVVGGEKLTVTAVYDPLTYEQIVGMGLFDPCVVPTPVENGTAETDEPVAKFLRYEVTQDEATGERSLTLFGLSLALGMLEVGEGDDAQWVGALGGFGAMDVTDVCLSSEIWGGYDQTGILSEQDTIKIIPVPEAEVAFHGCVPVAKDGTAVFRDSDSILGSVSQQSFAAMLTTPMGEWQEAGVALRVTYVVRSSFAQYLAHLPEEYFVPFPGEDGVFAYAPLL